MAFLFYDLETSGFSPKWQRFMQFAAQLVDDDLEPIAEPINELIALTDEILPDPSAILLTAITPQAARRDGDTEAHFWQRMYPTITVGNICIMGFNNIRFDDEFLRFSLWRNLRDPYAWGYKQGNSRWDLLDVARMTRALRPEGLAWPSTAEGKPVNTLGELVRANGIETGRMHTADVDVSATIAVARLIRDAQPKLWAWLHSLRGKQAVEQFITVQEGRPFIYTSGRYPSEYQHTSIVCVMGSTARHDGVWVYDLRVAPDAWLDKTEEELEAASEARERIPVKRLQYNRVPALAPLSTLDPASRDRLQVDMAQITKNHRALKDYNLADFLKRTDNLYQKRYAQSPATADVDGELYDGFLEDDDRKVLDSIVSSESDQLAALSPTFQDIRLDELYLRYKARNFPKVLTSEEREKWEHYRQQRLSADYGMSLEQYYAILQEKTAEPDLTDAQRELLTELDLYAQSIAPAED